MLVEVRRAVSITKFSQAEEVVREAWYDVHCAGLVRYACDGELGGRGGGGALPRRRSDDCFWCISVNVDERRCWCEVVFTRSSIYDCSAVACCDVCGWVCKWAAGGCGSG